MRSPDGRSIVNPSVTPSEPESEPRPGDRLIRFRRDAGCGELRPCEAGEPNLSSATRNSWPQSRPDVILVRHACGTQQRPPDGPMANSGVDQRFWVGPSGIEPGPSAL
jgi:hypothetical protein